jgi:chromosome segregation ATPase
MMEADSTQNAASNAASPSGAGAPSVDRIIQLQEQLLQAQERNLLLSAQANEFERTLHDCQDLQSEMAAQRLILTDKTRENKRLHTELSRVVATLESKLRELQELGKTVADLQHQLKTREAERDRLSEMLYKMEGSHKTNGDAVESVKKDIEKDNPPAASGTSWLRHLMGKNSQL